MQSELDARLERVAALGTPVRRALYRFVVMQTEPVNREQAAAGVGVAHHAAKFHLDRLVEDGLLSAEYRRPAGRGGPGAGRPAKLYRRSDLEVAVSLPERRYDLAGRLLVRAASESTRTGTPVAVALAGFAHGFGHELGADALGRLGRRPRRRQVLDAVFEVLAAQGFEPTVEGAEIILANCPFHALAGEDPELVCGMNLHFLDGVLDGAAAASLAAQLDPAPGRCCVTLRRR